MDPKTGHPDDTTLIIYDQIDQDGSEIEIRERFKISN